MHVEVAAPAAVHNRHAFIAQPELRSVLRAFGNFEFVRTFERRNFDLTAQSSLGDVDRNGAVQVLLAAFEESVFANFDEDVKVARRAAVASRLPFLGKTQ